MMETNLKRKWLSKVKPNIAVDGSYDPPDTLDRTPERLWSFYLTLQRLTGLFSLSIWTKRLKFMTHTSPGINTANVTK